MTQKNLLVAAFIVLTLSAFGGIIGSSYRVSGDATIYSGGTRTERSTSVCEVKAPWGSYQGICDAVITYRYAGNSWVQIPAVLSGESWSCDFSGSSGTGMAYHIVGSGSISHSAVSGSWRFYKQARDGNEVLLREGSFSGDASH